MPFYIEGRYYYTQVELREVLDCLLKTCWMCSNCKSEEERKSLSDSITWNFKKDHPEFEVRTEADDIAMEARHKAYMEARHKAYMAEEEVRRKEAVAKELVSQREILIARLRDIVAKGYHPEFYSKFCRFADKCKAGIEYRDYTKIMNNTLYFNPQSFLEIPKEYFYRPIERDVITVRDGGLEPIVVLITYTPIIELYNLENSVENTNNEYIYGTVLNAPEGVPYPKDSRIILQIKNICSFEGNTSVQKQENNEFDPVFA